MKKIYFLAAAVAAFLAVSCAKEKEKAAPAPQAPVEEVDDDTTPIPVLFGSQLNNVVETKAAVEKWDVARTLYIMGYETNEGGSIVYVNENNQPFIPNVAAAAPTGLDAAANANRTGIIVYNPAVHTDEPAYDEPFYYTDGKIYNFWGYYVDNAQTFGWANEAWDWENAQNSPAPTQEYDVDTKVLDNAQLPLKITGTQDIMLAQTDKDDDLANRSNFDKAVSSTNKFYSAWSARRGVNPNLVFEHQLSRFVFQIKKGGTVASNDITITGLKMKSFNKGVLTIVGQPTNVAVLGWSEQDNKFVPQNTTQPLYLVPVQETAEVNQVVDYVFADLPLCKADGTAVAEADAVHPTDAYVQLGESIMVMPGQNLYKFTLSLKQTNVHAGVPDQTLDIDLSNLATPYAEPGKQYLVKLIVYGVEDVKVTVSLTDWVNGGEVEIDPDADEEDNRTDNSLTVAQTALTIAAGDESAAFAISGDGAISGSSATDGIALVKVTDAVAAIPAVLYADLDDYNADHPGAPISQDEFDALQDDEKIKVPAVPAVPATYKVTVANTVAATGENPAYVLTVKAAGNADKKPATQDIAVTVTNP